MAAVFLIGETHHRNHSPSMPRTPLVVNSAVYRFAWLGCLGLSFLCFCAKRFHVWFTNLHNSIRDDRYLIGRRLHNFGEDNTQREVETENVLDPDTDVGLRHRRNIPVEG
ncbi:hypothetical protein Hanom_Chr12g01151311 [Helianthus anomalus]